MRVGNRVKHLEHPEHGIGKIISKETIFSKDYYEVYFKDVDNIIQLTEQDLELVLDPAALLSQGYSASPDLLYLKTMAHQLETFYTGESFLSSVNFKIKPLPHQLLALNFVLNQFKPRCLLADEVGLGKTIEAALIFEELKLRGMAKRILIITPAGLTRQWQEELELKFSEEFYLLDSDKAKALYDLHGQEGNIWHEFDQVITSIDFLKPKKLGDYLNKTEYARRKEHNERIYQACIEANWDVVIFDEAHKLTKYQSGGETARYKLGSALANVSPIFLLLTATPHSGKTDVFQNLLRLIDPHLFYSKDNLTPEKVKEVSVRNKKRAVVDMEGNRIFKNRITTICKISREQEEDKVEQLLYEKLVEYVSEYYNQAKLQKNNMLVFLLMLYQRIVSSSTRALISSLEKRYNKLKELESISKKLDEIDLELFLDLNGEEQLEFIEDNMAFINNPYYIEKEINILEECLSTADRSLKINHDAKFRQLLKIIDEVKQRENNPEIKMIIFTEFIETQKYIQEGLEQLSYKTASINGHMSLEEKIQQKNIFREEAQFLISTDAGGEGINLQFCFYMVNYDLPWNPMKLEQRIGRIDRIGQKEDVKIFNFVLSGTIEEYVYDTLEDKLSIIKDEFGEDKLRDILSTLQEDFNFDKVYFDAVVEREKEAEKLNDIAEQIYNKAQSILQEEEFLIPFTESEDGMSKEDKKILNEMPNKIKSFVASFLEGRNLELQEYSKKDDLYYFKNNFKTNKFPKHFSQVIFDPSQGLNNEEADLLSLQHDYIKDLIKEVKENGLVSAFTVKDTRFKDKTGLLGFWQLKVENNYDYKRVYYIPIFIEDSIRYNRRISSIFSSIEKVEIDKSTYLPDNDDIMTMYKKAEQEAEKEAEDYFLEDQLNWQQKLDERLEQLKEYYNEKERAIQEIKIDNIRESRLKMIEEEWLEREKELKERGKLFPKLRCEQLSFIRFR
ncbi:DEAD/DEAH box helicase [Natronospora cellulosivora (SeqCode)]